jgi:hypothetical protein
MGKLVDTRHKSKETAMFAGHIVGNNWVFLKTIKNKNSLFFKPL